MIITRHRTAGQIIKGMNIIWEDDLWLVESSTVDGYHMEIVVYNGRTGSNDEISCGIDTVIYSVSSV